MKIKIKRTYHLNLDNQRTLEKVIFVVVQVIKKSACNPGDLGSIPWSGRPPGEGNGNPFWRSPWIEEPGGLQSMG